MGTLMQKLTTHLAAATSVFIIVAVALAGLWTLAGWLGHASFEATLIQSAVLVLGSTAILTYVFYFARIVLLAQHSHGPVPPSLVPGEPPTFEDVTRKHWKNVGVIVAVFALLLGVGMLVGSLAKGASADALTTNVFSSLERGTLFLSTAGLVFGLTLMTAHSLRGVMRSFSWAAFGERPAELRRNLPLDVAFVTLPSFVVILLV